MADGTVSGDALVAPDAPAALDTASGADLVARDAGVADGSPEAAADLRPADLLADERSEDARPEASSPDANVTRSLFTTQVPDPISPLDGPYELGVRFRSTTAGDVVGIRYSRAAGDQGPHIGHLWAVDGTLLATVAFVNESASG
jgi:hypothetical protein